MGYSGENKKGAVAPVTVFSTVPCLTQPATGDDNCLGVVFGGLYDHPSNQYLVHREVAIPALDDLNFVSLSGSHAANDASALIENLFAAQIATIETIETAGARGAVADVLFVLRHDHLRLNPATCWCD
jgi:hypothetical protein